MEINELLESINLCIKSNAKACKKCRYNGTGSCAVNMMVDALKVMTTQQQRIAELEAERDELIMTIRFHCGCDICKHEALDADEYPCNECRGSGGPQDKWEWRGVRQEG